MKVFTWFTVYILILSCAVYANTAVHVLPKLLLEKKIAQIVKFEKKVVKKLKVVPKHCIKNIPEVTIEKLIIKHSNRYGIDARVIRAIAWHESRLNKKALSIQGAIGIMQLMPDTAKALGVIDPWCPDQNVRGGVKYFKHLLKQFGDLKLALAAYNAGPAAVNNYNGIPPYKETQRYVKSIMKELAKKGYNGYNTN